MSPSSYFPHSATRFAPFRAPAQSRRSGLVIEDFAKPVRHCAVAPWRTRGHAEVNGTFDGSTSGSHFGFEVLYGTGARGQFQCNMAGNPAFDGLREMGLEGTVSTGAVNVATGTATFSGTAILHVNGAPSTIGFEVQVHSGGPAVGWLHLTVFNSPFGPVF